jgi:chitodextrinase
VTGYIVRRNGTQVATPATTSFVDSGLSAGTTYSYTVAARDAAGNISPNSTSVSVTTPSVADTTPPSQPAGLTAAAAGSTGANLSWNASTDNVGVTGYIVRRNGTQVATPATTSFVDSGLSAGTTYSYTVAARDAAGNISTPASANVTTATAQPPVAGTYYVAADGSNSNTCASAQNALTAKLTIQAGFGCLAPGDSLVIRDGTYSGSANAISGVPNGSPGNYITIKAENEGNVIIIAGLNLDHTNSYLIFQGLRFQNAGDKTIVGNHLKFFRNEFKGGCPSGNCANTTVGTNDFNDTGDILFEDNWWHGLGGRYNLLIYNANRVVVRRAVIRHDGGWTDTKGDPEAGLNFYNSTNCSAQNVTILDSNLAYDTWQSAFYSVHNSASPNANTNNSWLGIIALNNLSGSDGAGLRFDGDASQSSHVVQDAVLWDANWGMNVAFTSSVGVTASRLTIGKSSGSGTGIDGGSGGTKTISNVRFFGMGAGSGVTVTNTVTGKPTFLTQQLAGVGADIVNRIGTAETFQGDTGWNVDTGLLLWPFPNEARIKKEMCTDAGVTRGFCSDPVSLTNYIMNYLGNGDPYP